MGSCVMNKGSGILEVILSRDRERILPSKDEKPRSWGYVVARSNSSDRSAFLAIPYDGNYILLKARINETNCFIKKDRESVELLDISNITDAERADDILYESARKEAMYSEAPCVIDDTTGTELFR